MQNLMKPLTLLLRSTPPLSTTSYWWSSSPPMAAFMAARVDAQAASVTKFGPRKLNRLQTRPAITLDSSPGMVSSVISGERLV